MMGIIIGSLAGMVTGATAQVVLEKIEMNPEFRDKLSVRTGVGTGLITAILIYKNMMKNKN